MTRQTNSGNHQRSCLMPLLDPSDPNAAISLQFLHFGCRDSMQGHFICRLSCGSFVQMYDFGWNINCVKNNWSFVFLCLLFPLQHGITPNQPSSLPRVCHIWTCLPVKTTVSLTAPPTVSQTGHVSRDKTCNVFSHFQNKGIKSNWIGLGKEHGLA